MRLKHSNDEILPGNKGKLQEKFFQIVNAEARLWLFKKMLERGIATRDVQSFIENQASLRREFKQIDTATLKVAMRAKHDDTIEHIKALQKEVGVIRKDLLADLSNKKHRLRKVSKFLKKEPLLLKEKLMRKYKVKIDHLLRVQQKFLKGSSKKEKEKIKKIQTIVPNCLSKYGDLTIFKPSSDFPKPAKAVGPFICNPNIKLSKEEMSILQKQPKFSLRENITDIEVASEIEKMM